MTSIDTYLQQVFPNKIIRDNVLNFLSQILKGNKNEHKVYVFQGSGSNGKTTFLNLIRKVMGSLSITVLEDELYTNEVYSQSFIKRIKDKRLIICETQENYVPTQIKSYLGTDTFIPNFDVILVTNKQMLYQDMGMSRRVEVIPFESTFVLQPEPNNPNQFKREYINEEISKLASSFISLLK